MSSVINSSQTKSDASGITRRLDIIINLLLESSARPSKTTTDKIIRLLDFGLSDSETATIVGKEPKYVTAVKSQVKARTLGRTRRTS
jgi:hypothetical protein